VIDYLGDKTVDINVLELSQQLPSLPTQGAERVAAANLEYPIIVMKSGGQYRYVLDGNHRLQKSIDNKVETIKAKILDLDNPETPEMFKRMFG
jgi:ParB-like chromosome segregation protein Spo0J